MCVIIIKQKGKLLPKEVAKTSGRINPHGLGIIWLDTFEVTYHKSSQHAVLDTERPFIAHFRYATIGAIGKENTHPFRCGANRNEWLMMNGTIFGLGDAKKSDSRVLAESLGKVPRHKWKKELEKHNSRFVTINTRNRTYQIYNKELWTQRDGVWYSKNNVLEDNLVAVYGTLKKGYSNYNRFLTSSKHVGKGKTQDNYPLIISGLPYLLDMKGIGHNVEVDVFKVTDDKVNELDALEGHPHWYCRKQIPIKMKDGRVLTCWIYFNLAEKYRGQEVHESYSQTFSFIKEAETKKWWEEDQEEVLEAERIIGRQLYLDEFIDDDNDFDVKNEKPVCINCFHDLVHDGFCNYHCSGCNDWFAEHEVLSYGA
jgi:gamma-glutamylcyclotransferase (GGCT)/AIG2-like uncharacterized protein YtfP